VAADPRMQRGLCAHPGDLLARLAGFDHDHAGNRQGAGRQAGSVAALLADGQVTRPRAGAAGRIYQAAVTVEDLCGHLSARRDSGSRLAR
jgi:hypothetical protein